MTDKETNTELPIQDCDISIRVGRDGVWLHFGDYAAIHVHNTLGDKSGIMAAQINKWCIDRQEQAKQIDNDNSQFGVDA